MILSAERIKARRIPLFKPYPPGCFFARHDGQAAAMPGRADICGLRTGGMLTDGK